MSAESEPIDREALRRAVAQILDAAVAAAR